MSGNNTCQLFKRGFGPSDDDMFSQSKSGTFPASRGRRRSRPNCDSYLAVWDHRDIIPAVRQSGRPADRRS